MCVCLVAWMQACIPLCIRTYATAPFGSRLLAARKVSLTFLALLTSGVLFCNCADGARRRVSLFHAARCQTEPLGKDYRGGQRRAWGWGRLAMRDGTRLTQLRLYINQDRAGNPSSQRRRRPSQEGVGGSEISIRDWLACVYPCVFGNPREDELPEYEKIVCN